MPRSPTARSGVLGTRGQARPISQSANARRATRQAADLGEVALSCGINDDGAEQGKREVPANSSEFLQMMREAASAGIFFGGTPAAIRVPSQATSIIIKPDARTGR